MKQLLLASLLSATALAQDVSTVTNVFRRSAQMEMVVTQVVSRAVYVTAAGQQRFTNVVDTPLWSSTNLNHPGGVMGEQRFKRGTNVVNRPGTNNVHRPH